MDMKKKIRNFFTLSRKANGGFTLVELIVVIAILAILAGVAVPAYSGYIKKAEKAGDLQLLGAVNTAFQSACMAEGTTAAEISSASLTWDGAKVVGISSPAELDSAFKKFYAGNEGTEFKVLAGKLVYSNGVFVEMSSGLASVMDAILGDTALSGSIQAVKNSVFSEIGYGTLAEQMDNASNLLAGFVGQTSSGFHALLTNEANMATLGKYLTEDQLNAAIAANLEAINKDPKYASLTDTQKQNLAQGQIMANAAVLTAAQNTEAITPEFITSLENGNAVDLLKGSTDGGTASSDTIAQAAFAYAMYTSYKASQGEEVSGDVNIADVYETLATDGFKTYMKNDSAADQAGYHGAMDLIAGSAEKADSTTASDLLINGFNNADLVALIEGITK